MVIEYETSKYVTKKEFKEQLQKVISIIKI